MARNVATKSDTQAKAGKTTKRTAARGTVVLTKNDGASELGQRIKAGFVLLMVAAAAGATVYWFGDDLRAAIGTGLDWTTEHVAGWLASA